PSPAHPATNRRESERRKTKKTKTEILNPRRPGVPSSLRAKVPLFHFDRWIRLACRSEACLSLRFVRCGICFSTLDFALPVSAFTAQFSWSLSNLRSRPALLRLPGVLCACRSQP
ncbi:unnamed protein product, partial [Scytosiphon promiscuus]